MKNILEAFWLRLETALWRSRDIQVIRESDFKFNGKFLDMGGRDGILIHIYTLNTWYILVYFRSN